MQINSIQSNFYSPAFTAGCACKGYKRNSADAVSKDRTDYVLYYLEHYNVQKVNNYLEKKTRQNTEDLENQLCDFTNVKDSINRHYKMHDSNMEDIRNLAQNNLLNKAIKDYRRAQEIVNNTILEYGSEAAPTLKFARILDKADIKNGSFTKRTKVVEVDGVKYRIDFDGASLNKFNYLKIENTKNKTAAYFKRAVGQSSNNPKNPFGYVLRKVETPDYTINTHWLQEGAITSISLKIPSRCYAVKYKGTYNLTNTFRPNISYLYPTSKLATTKPDWYYFQYSRLNPGQLEMISSDALKNESGEKIAYYSGEEEYYQEKTHPLLHEEKWGYMFT